MAGEDGRRGDAVRSAVSEHRGMIKQMRGVPGVIPERFEEGMDPRHCAC